MGDTREFKDWTRRVVIAAADAAVAQLQQEAQRVVSEMKAIAPVKTGRLRDSIRMEQGRTKATIVIRAGGPTTTVPVRQGQSATYDYALAQEWGTQKQPAGPFFYPIWRKGRQRTRRNINRAMKQAVEAE